MRFLDSSVFLHAYLKPRRPLTKREMLVKERAKEIIKRIDEGSEEVLTTVVHISEVLNIIESRLGLLRSIEFLNRILSLPNITIVGIQRKDYESALILSARYNVSLNDSIAYLKMKEKGIYEIYTFDKHFKNFPDIKII